MGPLLAREGVDLSLTTPGQNDRVAFAGPSTGDVTLTVVTAVTRNSPLVAT
jgi:hypothetical protein